MIPADRIQSICIFRGDCAGPRRPIDNASAVTAPYVMRNHAPEVDAVVDRIRQDPELVARYDITGDGQLDEREWELVRRMVALELRTAAERKESWSLEETPQVLNDRFEVIGLLGRGGQAFTHE